MPVAEPEEVPVLPPAPALPRTDAARLPAPTKAEGQADPSVRAAEPPVAPAPRKPAADHTGQGTILLVEDEDPVRAVNSRAPLGRGYTVLEAASGLEALAIVRENAQPIDSWCPMSSCRDGRARPCSGRCASTSRT